MERERIRCPKLLSKIMTAEEAASFIQDGMVVGTSGFTPSGYPKAIPLALAERIRRSGERLKIDLLAGASVGDELDDALAAVDAIRKRMPYQTGTVIQQRVNTVGGIEYQDQHISLAPQNTRYGFYGELDLAIVEACAITETGGLIPTTSVGSTPTFVQVAKKVLVEINTSQPLAFEGMHDIYTPLDPPHRLPIPLVRTDQRIGTSYIPCDPEKIIGIVMTDIPDNVRPLAPIDENARKMAGHVIDFFQQEVAAHRLPKNLLPLQSGIGSVANAVLTGLAASDFENLAFYSEVLQDTALDLVKSGKFTACSATAIVPSPAGLQKFYEHIDLFRQKIILRPQEISNHPEVIRRLGVLSMNTAVEADIYGHINSTHVMGTKMLNGIGGSSDLARSAYLTIFFTASTAKGGHISSIVPMCSHVDHTEHDVDIIITEQGLADLRNKSPRERAQEIIDRCAHPDYRALLRDYFQRACAHNPAGKNHTPHILAEALAWHVRFNETGSMKTKS